MISNRIRANNAGGLLGADPGLGTTVNFGSSPTTMIPTLTGSQYVVVVLYSSTTFEISHLTAPWTSGTSTGTVIRAAEDSTNYPAVAHPGGSWACVPTILDYDDGVTSFNTRVGDITLEKSDVTGTGLTYSDVDADQSGAAATAQSNAETFATDAVATETSRAEGAESTNATAIAAETTRAEGVEALKSPLISPTFTGVPAGPTASPGTNTTQLSTTAFVTAAITAGLATISPLTGDVTTVGGAATLVGTSNVESIIRAQAPQIFAIGPSALTNFNNQGIVQLASVNMTDGTAADGSIALALNAPVITALGNSGNSQPVWQLGMVGGNPSLLLGPGGSGAPDVSLIRTGGAAATFTGALKTTSLLTANGALTVNAGQTVTLTGAPTPAVSLYSGTTTTLNFAFAGGSLASLSGTFVYQQAGFLTAGLVLNSVFKNLSTAAVGFGGVTGITVSPTFTADTQSINAGNLTSFAAAPIMNVANAGTMTGAAVIGFSASVAPATGVTLTSLTGFTVVDPTTAGTITLHVGVDIPTLTKATTSIGVRLGSMNNPLQMTARTTGPDTANLSSNSNAVFTIYKGATNSYFLIAWNDAGTVRYKYLELTGTGATWATGTSLPT